MKKSLLFLTIFSLFCLSGTGFSQTSDQPDTDPFQSPYFKAMQQKAFSKTKENMIKNKEKIMESLDKVQKYTDEEYQTLYNNYEVNPPFIDKDGILELNPDYISKNKKYIEKDGNLVENKNYQPNPDKENQDIMTLINLPKEEKRLGKKGLSINPDAFY